MANDVAAASLSHQQRKRSLNARKNKAPVKTVLCTPYVAKWPHVDSADQQYILQQIKRCFELHCIEDVGDNTKQKQKIISGTENDVKAKMEEQQLPRREIVCGVQSVTRSLEQDKLRLVIVDRSAPWQLHQHLAQLSAVRQCPSVAVDNMAHTLSAVLAVTRLCALGFKKLTQNSVFDDVIQDVSSRCPSVDLPWLDTAIGLANIQQTVEKCARTDYKCEQSADNELSDISTDDDVSKSTAAGCRQVTDYSYLYIYKKNATFTPARSQTAAEYIALSSSSSDEDENDRQLVSVADVGSMHDTLVTVANTSPTTSILSPKYSKLYRSPNTGVQIENPNKKRNKNRKRC